MLRAALIDAGGTIWPDTWPVWTDEAVRRLGEGCDLSVPAAKRLVQALADVDPDSTPPRFTQDTIALIASAVRASGLSLQPEAVLEALDIPAVALTQPFEGVDVFLRELKEHGLRTVVVSNAFFRTQAGYRRDLADLGLAQWVDDVLSSADTGVRKPHVEMFRLALAAARSSPPQTVMIGDSEVKDIAPAKQLGMRTIRAAFEGELPTRSEADAVVTSLAAAAQAVRRWL